MNSLKIHPVVSLSIAGLIAVWLSACGVSTQETAPEDTLTLLNAFSLTGNDTPIGTTERIAVPMQDSNETASALFDISWDATSSDPYQVTAHVSSDASFILDASDTVFLDFPCGSDNTQYSCDFLGDLECGFRYEPDYVYLRDPLTGEFLRDPEGKLIRDTYSDGSYKVTAHHVYLGCGNNGPDSTFQAEITDRVVLGAGFPGSELNYVVFTVCNSAGDSCSAALVQIQIYDSFPG